MFKKLCSTDLYKNTVVVTTSQDKISEQEGQERESQMKSSFFRELVAGDAFFVRYMQDYTVATQKLMNHIFTLGPMVPMIVKQIREGKRFVDIAGGSMTEPRLMMERGSMPQRKTDLTSKTKMKLKTGNEREEPELEDLRMKIRERAKVTARWRTSESNVLHLDSDGSASDSGGASGRLSMEGKIERKVTKENPKKIPSWRNGLVVRAKRIMVYGRYGPRKT
ncbi:hypothetical protein BDP27DRAFT_1372367 [Rhodocollybia butyracea]|uniref:Uncharacterized protein n=1 Tax=Rhodocollybia butyracea TaxID=206335 RepID=A0A9P5P8C4_9AGAR|nr:hypothetical protein BDP27DRAFT_1372367 [Rhodocollybia butyracea]